MAEPQLVPVFIPALVSLLANAEWRKGSSLTEQEVLAIRNSGVCMMMRVEHAIELDHRRGYKDVDPERVWEQWQEVRNERLGLSAGSERAGFSCSPLTPSPSSRSE